MSKYSGNIKKFLIENNIKAEFLKFDNSVHSVREAVEVSGFPVERFTKSIVMLTSDNDIVIAVVAAENRASTERVRKALRLCQRPRLASAEESEKYLGQQLGGNSPLPPLNAKVLIDQKVLEKEWILVGGGDDRSLVKISIEELTRVIPYTKVRVRK